MYFITKKPYDVTGTDKVIYTLKTKHGCSLNMCKNKKAERDAGDVTFLIFSRFEQFLP